MPEEILITEVEGPKGTAEIFEVTLSDVGRRVGEGFDAHGEPRETSWRRGEQEQPARS